MAVVRAGPLKWMLLQKSDEVSKSEERTDFNQAQANCHTTRGVNPLEGRVGQHILTNYVLVSHSAKVLAADCKYFLSSLGRDCTLSATLILRRP